MKAEGSELERQARVTDRKQLGDCVLGWNGFPSSAVTSTTLLVHPRWTSGSCLFPEWSVPKNKGASEPRCLPPEAQPQPLLRGKTEVRNPGSWTGTQP